MLQWNFVSGISGCAPKKYQKTKKPIIRIGTIDSRCHPDSERRIFPSLQIRSFSVRAENPPVPGMISSLCNVRATASDTRENLPFPSLLTESIRTGRMYRPHTICRLAGHRLPELLTFCSLRIFLSFVKIYDNVGAGKSQEIGKKREKRSNT